MPVAGQPSMESRRPAQPALAGGPLEFGGLISSVARRPDSPPFASERGRLSACFIFLSRFAKPTWLALAVRQQNRFLGCPHRSYVFFYFVPFVASPLRRGFFFSFVALFCAVLFIKFLLADFLLCSSTLLPAGVLSLRASPAAGLVSSLGCLGSAMASLRLFGCPFYFFLYGAVLVGEPWEGKRENKSVAFGLRPL